MDLCENPNKFKYEEPYTQRRSTLLSCVILALVNVAFRGLIVFLGTQKHTPLRSASLRQVRNLDLLHGCSQSFSQSMGPQYAKSLLCVLHSLGEEDAAIRICPPTSLKAHSRTSVVSPGTGSLIPSVIYLPSFRDQDEDQIWTIHAPSRSYLVV